MVTFQTASWISFVLLQDTQEAYLQLTPVSRSTVLLSWLYLELVQVIGIIVNMRPKHCIQNFVWVSEILTIKYVFFKMHFFSYSKIRNSLIP